MFKRIFKALKCFGKNYNTIKNVHIQRNKIVVALLRWLVFVPKCVEYKMKPFPPDNFKEHKRLVFTRDLYSERVFI